MKNKLWALITIGTWGMIFTILPLYVAALFGDWDVTLHYDEFGEGAIELVAFTVLLLVYSYLSYTLLREE